MDVVYSRILTSSAPGLIKVVIALYEQEYPTIIKLQRHLCISKQTCYAYLDFLEDTGLIVKKRSEDGNMVRVSLTSAGVEFAKLVMQLLKLENNIYAKKELIRHD